MHEDYLGRGTAAGSIGIHSQSEYAAKQFAAEQYAQKAAYPTEAPVQSQINESFAIIGSRLQDIFQLVNRTGNVADRVSGPVPQEVGKPEGAQTAPNTVMAKLSIAHDALGQIERQLRAHLERLERAI